MPHKSDPPYYGFDKDGNPLWGEHQQEYCKGHKHYLHRSKFAGVEWVQHYCKECQKKQREEKRKISHKPERNPLAFTHIIRHKNSSKLYKYHILQEGGIPENYKVIYQVKPGYLLPGYYRRYDQYEPKEQDTK